MPLLISSTHVPSIIFPIIISVVAVIVTVLTYTFFRSMESEVLEDNFVEISTMIVSDTTRSLGDMASSTRALSETYTAILGEGNDSCGVSSWPYVTLPGHDSIASAMLQVSHSRAAVFAPLLHGDEEVSQWEAYAVENAPPSVEDVVSDGIRSSEGGVGKDQGLFSESAPRVPAWQVAPADLMQAEGIMWDYYSHPPYKASVDRILMRNKEMKERRRRRLTSLEEEMASSSEGGETPVAATELIPCSETLLPLHLNPAPRPNPISDHDHWEGDGHRRLRHLSSEEEAEVDVDDFCTAIFYPVYDATPSPSNRKLARADVSGVAAELFSWSDMLGSSYQWHSYTLHEVRVVVESRLKLPDGSYRSTVATYSVEDGVARLLGQGRSTELGHEEMVQKYEFNFPGDDEVEYLFEVYPTDELCYQSGVSKRPVYLTIIAACVFGVSVLVFFVYDYYVK